MGTQAVFNVLMGERYKVATKETKDILLGKYGQTAKPFNPEIVDKVLGDEKKNAITCRPADLLEPELAKIESEMKQWKEQDEDVLTYALFPQVADGIFQIPSGTADQDRSCGGRYRKRSVSGLRKEKENKSNQKKGLP